MICPNVTLENQSPKCNSPLGGPENCAKPWPAREPTHFGFVASDTSATVVDFWGEIPE